MFDFDNLSKRQYWLLVIWGIFSFIEMHAWTNGWQAKYGESLIPWTFLYILVFNLGNLNNAFLCAYIIHKLGRKYIWETLLKFLIVILAIIVSLIMEREGVKGGDPGDHIGTAIGLIMYLYYFGD